MIGSEAAWSPQPWCFLPQLLPAGDPSQAFGALTNALTTAVKQFKQHYPDREVSAR